MQEAIERRGPQSVRVPLDEVHLEISPEGFDETFEADALNVGAGGLAGRSAILPDVGAKLRCRFQSPVDGMAVDADCEVVWAEDSGPNRGEFGLRFTALGSDEQRSITQLVEEWQDELDALAAASENPGSIDSAIAEPEPAGATGGTVRLELAGVGQPLDAEAVHRAGDVLVAEQGLPFLRIGTHVSEGEREGRLEAVDLRIDGGTPKLVLTVGFGGAPAAVEEPSADATLLDTPAPSAPAAEAEAGWDEHDHGWGDEDAGWDDGAHEEWAGEAAEGATPAAMDAPAEPEPAPEAPAVEEVARAKGPEQDVAKDAADDAEPSAEADVDAEAAAMRARPGVALAKMKSQLGPKLARGKAWLALTWARLLPFCRSGWARVTHFAGDLGRRLGPWMKGVAAKAKKRKTARPEGKKGAKRQTRAPKRRTTARPGARDGRPRGPEASAAPQKKRWGRWVLLALLALGAATFYAVRGAAASPSVTLAKLPKPPADPESGDARFIPAPPPSAPAEAPATAPEAAAETEAAEPAMPRALPEPSRSAGPMPAPSFPSLEERDSTPPTPGTVPQNSPYAVDLRDLPTHFGADAVEGEAFTIRMAHPVAGLRGEQRADGFAIELPGNRAEEGARQIASAHPHVERASILNQGSGAQLTVRFVSGRSPAYRVEGRGASLVVTIQR